MRRTWLATCLFLLGAVTTLLTPAGETPRIGPATEKRFPPLQLPPGFKATLFACDPFIEYPSVIAAGPKANQLLVAIDYVTGLGVEIVRRDEIRLIEDTDGDGYADKSTVYAAGFNSIQGLAYHDGVVYVMHAPFLTALRDTDRDGKADERKDLLSGLGLKPEDNPSRLHCANGVTVGHDGWLYLALGDNGCTVPRPEGDSLIFNGGGILRCRACSPLPPGERGGGEGRSRDRKDWWHNGGRDLHIFSTGLRNIYDVALDAELNAFVRDNENDGGDYMIRVCHSFFGADHGYPYLYYERPDEALKPLADLGRGSSAGVTCYLELGFPKEIRTSLFGCEWGKSLVRYELKREAGGFAATKEIEFATASPKDPYGFKPTDVVVHQDGSMFVSDWGDGQRPKRGRGRIYRITSEPKKSDSATRLPDPEGFAGLPKSADVFHRLSSPAYHIRMGAHTSFLRGGRALAAGLDEAWKNGRLNERGRWHAVWLFAQLEGADAVPRLLTIARTDPDESVRAQAIRAIGDLTDPVLTTHRLDAGRGDPKLARQLAEILGLGPTALLEQVIVLGRLRWADAPDWFRRSGLASPLMHEHALVHAMQQTLRRADNWPEVLKLLDMPDKYTLRNIASRALADQADSTIVDGLLDRLAKDKSESHRREYADLLTRVYKKRGPWKYWGYRPAPRPANTVAWERTEAIEAALNKVLAEGDPEVRFATLQRMQREKVAIQTATLLRWVQDDTDEQRVAVILAAARTPASNAEHELFANIVPEKKHAVSNRRKALSMWLSGLGATDPRHVTLFHLVDKLEDGPVLADALRLLRQDAPKSVFLPKVESRFDEVRAAAIYRLGHLKAVELEDRLPKLITEGNAEVRSAAAFAAGRMRVAETLDGLLKLGQEVDPSLRRASLDALREFADPRAAPLALAALKDPATRDAAWSCLNRVGRVEHVEAMLDFARRQPSSDVLPPLVRMLSGWQRQIPTKDAATLERSLCELQGQTGVLAYWQVKGSMAPKAARQLIDQWSKAPDQLGELPRWQASWPVGSDWIISLHEVKEVAPPKGERPPRGGDWVALADFVVREAAPVQFLGASRGGWRVWLNGRLVYENNKPGPFVGDPDRFEATLVPGVNRLSLQVSSSTDKSPDADFRLRFRKKSAAANHEALVQAALNKPGNAERGKKLFFDAAKAQCVKCHKIGDQGDKIGPDLTGVGNRFARVYLIESILEPSRAIAPSYETLHVELKDGRVLSGVRVTETPDALTLGDTKGEKHVLPRSQIDAVRPLTVSTMPEGLERGLSADEFVDLVAFLVGQK